MRCVEIPERTRVIRIAAEPALADTIARVKTQPCGNRAYSLSVRVIGLRIPVSGDTCRVMNARAAIPKKRSPAVEIIRDFESHVIVRNCCVTLAPVVSRCGPPRTY